jgi:hypothetical protein
MTQIENNSDAKQVESRPTPRNLTRELIGTIISMLTGAFVGLMTGGNGLGFVSFVVLCSFLGWVIWIRRKRSILATIGICFLIVIICWPFGLMLRELGRGYF